MKVTIKNETKKLLWPSEINEIDNMIDSLKDDTCKPAEYLRMAANLFGYCTEIISCKAQVYPNINIHDLYTENSGNLDVWIEGLASMNDGYLEIGCYLSDVWQIGPDWIKETLASRMYTRYAKF